MNSLALEVLEYVKEENVKFVKLIFCDLFGFLKSVAILADELPNAFENGVSFDGNAINGFYNATESDLFLFPDPKTMSVLPWRSGSGSVIRFYCDVKYCDGSTFEMDSRSILARVEQECRDLGFTSKIGSECEFYLFKNDEFGEPTETTLDNGEYFDVAPLDKGENIRREICLTLEEMGIIPETSHHERGPGQNEVDFKASSPLKCADNFMTFKNVVKAIANRSGLHASFMPKPIENAPGNGMHINISLFKDGKNLFADIGKGVSKTAESFIAGVLKRSPEITLFLNPLANSYERFGEFEAPKYVSWSHKNRSQLVRIPAAANDKMRMELRSPDPSLNPYLAFALILSAGLEGVKDNLQLPPALDVDLYTANESITENLACLPESIEQAISWAGRSDFVKNVVGRELFNRYLSIKEGEALEHTNSPNKAKFYKNKYFRAV